MTHTNKTPLKTLAALAACLLLAACSTTAPSDGSVQSAVERAAMKASGKGNLPLTQLEQAYKKDPENVDNAVSYAAGLRKAEKLNLAAIVLAPFANEAAGAAAAKTEYAAILLAQGNYDAAEEYAQKAVLQSPEDYEAYHYLGIALDAKGMHPEAERAFRKGLDLWQGDPTTIMNNLALNLTAQGFLKEAAEILYKAQALAPDRKEIERNLRIVLALQQSSPEYFGVPKPPLKPKAPVAAATAP